MNKKEPSLRMKSLMRMTLFTCLAFGLALSSVCPLFPETIVLIHSNDTHGTYRPSQAKVNGEEKLLGGMEAASHYINTIRAKEKSVLLIETGDLLTGTLASEIEYKGVAGGVMVEFLNRLDYDIWCFGNHDFDKGHHNVLKLAELAKFPTVMANIVYRENRRLFSAEPYHIFEIGGVKVGVIAVMEENFLIEVQRESVKGLDVLPSVTTLNSYIPELDKQTDLIVVVSHGWFEQGEKIARDVAGIDVVLVAAEDGMFKELNGVLVKSTIGHQKTLGYLKLEVEKDKIESYEEKLIWLWADGNLKPSPGIAAFVKEVTESIGSEYGEVLGEAKVDLIIEGSPKKSASVENALGNWITDVMRWKTGTQIGLHNTGAIRANIRKGKITKADIFNVAPFCNTLIVFKLTGQQLKDALEFDVERDWDRLQVSGLRYKYFPKETKSFGERVFYIEVEGEALEEKGKVLWPEKIYSIVSNNYLVGHAQDKYFGFPVADSRDTGIPLDLTLMEWLEKQEVLDYTVEGRIVEIKK